MDLTAKKKQSKIDLQEFELQRKKGEFSTQNRINSNFAKHPRTSGENVRANAK